MYHDLGNLNFTFVLPKAAYDLARQTRVILEAARLLGAPAEASGRNDILAGGHKFSGNAYYRRGEIWYHHGTLLVDTDLDALGRYLNVSPKKLAARGVASVRSARLQSARICAGGDRGGGAPGYGRRLFIGGMVKMWRYSTKTASKMMMLGRSNEEYHRKVI